LSPGEEKVAFAFERESGVGWESAWIQGTATKKVANITEELKIDFGMGRKCKVPGHFSGWIGQAIGACISTGEFAKVGSSGMI